MGETLHEVNHKLHLRRFLVLVLFCLGFLLRPAREFKNQWNLKVVVNLCLALTLSGAQFIHLLNMVPGMGLS